MSFKRVFALVMRYLYVFKRNLDRLSDAFYWPIIDIIVWGLASVWIQKSGEHVPNLILILLTAVIFWHIVWRSNYEISVNLLEEFWNRNFVNLFSTPLKVSEWIASVTIVGFLKSFVTLGFTSVMVFFLYKLNIFTGIGFYMIPFVFLLLMSGWIFGFLGASLIMYFGRKAQSVAWMMGYLFAPFSAVFYPIDILPPWIQKVAAYIPTSYIFEGMRELLFKNTLNMRALLISFFLSIIYMAIVIIIFVFAFNKAKKIGFSKLD